MGDVLTGRCLCGGVSYSAPLSGKVSACHCSMCRRWTSGPMMTIECEGPIAFKGGDLIALFASSDVVERGFCKACGSSLFTKMIGQEHYWLAAGSVDDASRLTFDEEVFIDDKPHFYAFANDTRKLTGAEFLAAWADDAKS